MERLDRLSAYFNEREKKRLETKTKEANNGVPEMSVDEIRLTCLQNNGYETPELNDKLYLHFRGFRRIEHLDAYTGCKSIWLDSNGFDKIENLDALKELRCLYLSKNLIRKVEGLSSLVNLTILDLSYNRLTHLENLSCCPALQTLNVSYNSLSTVHSIRHLEGCQALTNIDITNNRLENNEEFITFLPTIPNLITLSINGNDITKISSFRKKMIAAMPRLCYLDRPVEEQERLFAVAFMNGGNEAEMIARQDWKEKQNQKRIAEMQEFRSWQKEQQRLREQARVEGRPLIREFTPEEQEERRLEAEQAANAEKEMLANGIDKLAGRYWQLEGRAENQGKDILDMAAEQLRVEKERKAQKEAEREEEETTEVAVNDITIEVDQPDVVNACAASPVRDGLTAATAISLPEETTHKIEITEISEDDEEEEEEEVTVKVVEEPTEEELREKAALEEEQRLERERQKQEEKEQYERQQRVFESFEIYKKQFEARKNPSNASDVTGYKHHNTWAAASLNSSTSLITNTATATPATSSTVSIAAQRSIADEWEDQENRPLYWSEVMDIELAKQVKANVFDFQKISECMIEAAKWRRLDNHFIHQNPEALTKDVCRLRWAELDANNWSVQAPGITAKDTVFRINLTDDILQKTGGAQPSYEALASLTKGNRPSYLKVPTAFPSVKDINDELD